MKKLNIALISREQSSLAGVESVFRADKQLMVTHFGSAQKVLQAAKSNEIDVAIVSEELMDTMGMRCVKDIVAANPFINCALVSSLHSDEFHEETEGLGVFMQLPVYPDAADARRMLEHLSKIYQL